MRCRLRHHVIVEDKIAYHFSYNTNRCKIVVQPKHVLIS